MNEHSTAELSAFQHGFDDAIGILKNFKYSFKAPDAGLIQHAIDVLQETSDDRKRRRGYLEHLLTSRKQRAEAA